MNGDTLDEIDETFTVTLSDPTNATIADGIGLGTILDDDAPPALSVNDVTVTEGDAGTVDAVFTVTLAPVSRPHGHGRLRDRRRHGDGAPADYEAAGGHADLRGRRDDARRSPSRSTATCSTRSTRRSSSTSRTRRTRPSATARALGTITDNDPLPTLVDQRRDGDRGQRRHGDATFTVSADAPSGRTVTVDYATRTARRPRRRDYDPVAIGALDLRSGRDDEARSRSPSTATCSTRRTRRSSSTSPARRTPRSPTARASARSPTTTRLPTLSIDDVDGDRGQHRHGQRDLHRHPRAPERPQRHGRLRDRRRHGRRARRLRGDKRARSRSRPAQTTKTITVPVNGDVLDEANETLLRQPLERRRTRRSPTARASARSPTTTARRRSRSTTRRCRRATRGTRELHRQPVSAPSGQTVTRRLRDGERHRHRAGRLHGRRRHAHLHPGPDHEAGRPCRSADDLLDELDETFLVNLTTPTNATIADGQAVGTITDNDAAAGALDRRRDGRPRATPAPRPSRLHGHPERGERT